MARSKRGLNPHALKATTDHTAEALVRRILNEPDSVGIEREVTVSLAQLDPAPWQSRRDYGEEQIKALAKSIERDGLLQPLLVRPHPNEDGQYQVIFGHRRFEALRIITRSRSIDERDYHLHVRIRQCSDIEGCLLTTVENIHRKDLSRYELARNVADVQRALITAGLPNGDRDMAAIFGLSAGSIAEYRVIGTRIQDETLRQAGFVRRPNCNEIDWSLVGELTKEQLFAAARASTHAATVLRLQHAADRLRTRREDGESTKKPSHRLVPNDRSPRYTAESLWERGKFAVKLSRPFREYTPDESRRYLADLLPAVAALARKLKDGYVTAPAEKNGSYLCAILEGDPCLAKSLQELSTFLDHASNNVEGAVVSAFGSGRHNDSSVR